MSLRCIVIDDDKIQRELLVHYIKDTDQLELLDAFDSAVKASNFLRSEEVDLIFLDIEMPVMNGLELLTTMKGRTEVILVSSKEKYAVESYEYEISDYLLKPVSYSRFFKAVNKVSERKQESSKKAPAKEIFVKVNSAIKKVALEDILFVEAAVDYVYIFTATQKYLVSSSMSNIMEKFPTEDFMRVHRSHIVRIDKINKIEGNLIQIGKKTIRISKSYKEEVLRRIDYI